MQHLTLENIQKVQSLLLNRNLTLSTETEGFLVPTDKDQELAISLEFFIDGACIPKSIIKDFVIDNAAKLIGNNKVAIWLEGDVMFLDIVEIISNLNEALSLAKERGKSGVVNLESGLLVTDNLNN